MERDINVVVRIKEDGSMSFLSGDGLPIQIGGGSTSENVEIVIDEELFFKWINCTAKRIDNVVFVTITFEVYSGFGKYSIIAHIVENKNMPKKELYFYGVNQESPKVPMPIKLTTNGEFHVIAENGELSRGSIYVASFSYVLSD